MPQLFAALCDLAELALGCKTCKTRPSQAPIEPSRAEHIGGLVQLSSKGEALEVGVLATPEDCRALAERLLGRPACGAFPDSIVRGAMCELAYLLAGGVKRRMTGSGMGPISVGQPSFFAGGVAAKDGWRVRTTDVELDTIRATLVCVVRDGAAISL
jgi:hypothetical protein